MERPLAGSVDQRSEIGKDAVVETRLQREGEFGLAGALEREREKADHGAASWSLAETGEQGVERQGEGSAGEELIAIDQIEQRHRLAAQGMDDVTIVDDMAKFAVRLGPTAPQDDDGRRALKAFQPIVVEAHPQPVADQARGNRVEHLAQREGAGAGDVDVDLLVVGGLADRQLVRRRPLLVDALGVAEVAAADDVVDEAAPCGEIVEVARCAQHEGVGERSLRWPWALSIEPFSWLTPGLLRVGVMP